MCPTIHLSKFVDIDTERGMCVWRYTAWGDNFVHILIVYIHTYTHTHTLSLSTPIGQRMRMHFSPRFAKTPLDHASYLLEPIEIVTDELFSFCSFLFSLLSLIIYLSNYWDDEAPSSNPISWDCWGLGDISFWEKQKCTEVIITYVCGLLT